MSRTRLLALSVTAAVLFAGTPARAEITIGVAGPLSGSEAAFGEQFRRGAVKAVEDINAKGGVLGQKLVLAMGDDACDPKQAVAVANEMARQPEDWELRDAHGSLVDLNQSIAALKDRCRALKTVLHLTLKPGVGG